MKPVFSFVFGALLALTACDDGASNKTGDAPSGEHAEGAHAGEPDLPTLMRQLDQDVAQLNAALFRDDFEGVAKAANAIANHPHVSVSERERIQGALGEDFAKFVQGDKRTHESAATLATIATSKDLDGVLRELDTLTRSCVGCHEDFRARLRPGS